jgi:hypothetical protein
LVLNVEQVVLDYLEKYGYLFENDASILMEELKQKEKENKIREKYKKRKELIDKHKDTILDKLKDIADQVKNEYSGQLKEDFEDQIKLKTKKLKAWYYTKVSLMNRQQLKELSKVRSKSTLVMSGLALAAIISYMGYRLYKEEKTKNIKVCLNKKGKYRLICIKNNTRQSLMQRLYFLKRSIFKCKYSKDPVKCKSKIDQEMLKIERRLIEIAKEIALDIATREEIKDSIMNNIGG